MGKNANSFGGEKANPNSWDKEKEPDPATHIAAPEGASLQYANLFHVANNGVKFDKTAGQKQARKDWARNPVAMGKLLKELEAQHAVKMVGAGMGVGQEVLARDMGSERATMLLNELLDGFEEEERKRTQSGRIAGMK